MPHDLPPPPRVKGSGKHAYGALRELLRNFLPLNP